MTTRPKTLTLTIPGNGLDAPDLSVLEEQCRRISSAYRAQNRLLDELYWAERYLPGFVPEAYLKKLATSYKYYRRRRDSEESEQLASE